MSSIRKSILPEVSHIAGWRAWLPGNKASKNVWVDLVLYESLPEYPRALRAVQVKGTVRISKVHKGYSTVEVTDPVNSVTGLMHLYHVVCDSFKRLGGWVLGSCTARDDLVCF